MAEKLAGMVRHRRNRALTLVACGRRSTPGRSLPRSQARSARRKQKAAEAKVKSRSKAAKEAEARHGHRAMSLRLSAGHHGNDAG